MSKPGPQPSPFQSISQALTRRVLLLSLIGVLGIGSGIGLSLVATLQQVQERLASTTVDAVHTFDLFFLDIQGELLTTSSALANRPDVASALLQLRTQNTALLDVYLLAPDGAVLAQRSATGRPRQTKISRPDWLATPPPFGSVAIGPIRFEGDVPYVEMATPATDDLGLTSGLLLVRVDLTELWDTTLEVQVGQTGYAYIVDSSGQIVAYRNPQLLGSGSNLQQRVGRTPQSLAEAWLSFYTGLSGQPVLAAARPLRTVPWFAVVEQPVNEALLPLALPALLSLAVLLSVGLLFYNTLQFTRVRVVAPLVALRQAVGQMTEGQVPQRVAVRAPDELGILAQAFNDMTAKIYDTLTELEASLGSLQASEERQRLILETSPTAIVLTRFDGALVYTNSQFVDQFGLEDAHQLSAYYTNPAEHFAIVEKIRRQGCVQDYELRFRKPDGTLRWVLVSGRSLTYNAEAVLLISLIDITERKQMEEALRVTTSRLETLIRVSPLGITLLDTQGKVRLWNPAAQTIFGWQAEEVLGELNPIVPANRQDEYAAWSTQVLDGGAFVNQEAVRQRKDGTFVTVSLSTAPVQDALGNLAGRMALIADITERKRAEEEAKKQLDELAAWHDVTLGREARVMELKHEVNNLLAKLGQPPRYEDPGL